MIPWINMRICNKNEKTKRCKIFGFSGFLNQPTVKFQNCCQGIVPNNGGRYSLFNCIFFKIGFAFGLNFEKLENISFNILFQVRLLRESFTKNILLRWFSTWIREYEVRIWDVIDGNKERSNFYMMTSKSVSINIF